MVKKKKPKSPASVSVTPTSTYRVPAASTVIARSPGGGTTVSHSRTTRHDLRESSRINRESAPPTRKAPLEVSRRSPAEEAFTRLSTKAKQPVSIDPNIPPRSVAPVSGQPPSAGVTDDKGGFFTPSAEEGARRRQATFGTESKAVAGGVIGVVAAALIAAPWLVMKIAGSIGGTTAVSTLARVGTRGVTKAVTSSAGKFAANSATKAATGTWIQRLLTSTVTRTTTNVATGKAVTQAVTTTASGKAIGIGAAAGLLVGSIGSYPFAGFIEEEALQTLGFGVNSAKMNSDWEGADEAISLQEEILNPDLWSQIKSAIPFVNVLEKLNKFREAAVIKTAIDKRHVKDLRIQQETGETDDVMYARIRAEREEYDKQKKLDDEAYYANIEAQRVAAKAIERKEEENYWAKILADRPKEEQTYRSNEGDYWEGYWRALAENKKETPSKLTFGLL